MILTTCNGLRLQCHNNYNTARGWCLHNMTKTVFPVLLKNWGRLFRSNVMKILWKHESQRYLKYTDREWGTQIHLQKEGQLVNIVRSQNTSSDILARGQLDNFSEHFQSAQKSFWSKDENSKVINSQAYNKRIHVWNSKKFQIESHVSILSNMIHASQCTTMNKSSILKVAKKLSKQIQIFYIIIDYILL